MPDKVGKQELEIKIGKKHIVYNVNLKEKGIIIII